MATARFNDGVLHQLGEDPLSDSARSQHRNVLIVASLALLIGWLNLAPKRISAVGVPLHSNDRDAIRIALVILVAYLVIAFYAAAYADIAAWWWLQRASWDMWKRVDTDIRTWESEQPELEKRVQSDPTATTQAGTQYAERQNNLRDYRRRRHLYRSLVPISWIRALLDFVLPAGLSIAAIVELVMRIS